MFEGLLNWIDRLFNKHKFMRRLLMFWAIALITWTVGREFRDLSEITAASVSALGVVTAILGTVIGLYQWSRDRDK